MNKTMVGVILAVILSPLARSESATPTTPEAIVASLVADVGSLAATHAELADFPEYVKRLESRSTVDFQRNIKPFAVSIEKKTAPVPNKRRVRPSDCGRNGILIQFILDDGTSNREAPIDSVTFFPHLKRTLYADVVLWEKASPELKTKLQDIIARHKAMLSEMDKQVASKAPKNSDRKLPEPQLKR